MLHVHLYLLCASRYGYHHPHCGVRAVSVRVSLLPEDTGGGTHERPTCCTDDVRPCFPGSSGGRSGKADIVAAHPRGARVRCWVDPDDPTEAVLERGLTTQAFVGLVPAAFIALDAFPTTKSANGEKIQKVKLRDMATEHLARACERRV